MEVEQSQNQEMTVPQESLTMRIGASKNKKEINSQEIDKEEERTTVKQQTEPQDQGESSK